MVDLVWASSKLMPLQCRQVGNRRPLTELVSFTDEGERVIARLRGPAGQDETCEANYIAGCDGAHSTVRDTIGTAFPGGTYRHVFYVADVEAAGPPLNGELHVDLNEADFLRLHAATATATTAAVVHVPVVLR
jgi:2-polyprenyl-6-methoxyphenol hydroxylase-like FAD-dependent oxidoreductase